MYEYQTSVTPLDVASITKPLPTPDARPWRLRESKIVEVSRSISGTVPPTNAGFSTSTSETQIGYYVVLAVWELYQPTEEDNT